MWYLSGEDVGFMRSLQTIAHMIIYEVRFSPASCEEKVHLGGSGDFPL
jgi:hypothetical protein